MDGLILQPHGYGQQRGSNNSNGNNNEDGNGNGNNTSMTLPPPVLIEYQTHRISDLPAAASSRGVIGCESLEASGIVGKKGEVREESSFKWDADEGIYLGLLSVASYSFLISITQRQQVAQILSKPIYAITNVSVIPLSSQVEASKAIIHARKSAGGGGGSESAQAAAAEAEDSDTSDVETLRTSVEESVGGDDHDEIDAPATSPDREAFPIRGGKERNSIAEDVIGRKGQYGRFASHWFSRKGWSAGKRSSQGMSSEPSEIVSLAPITAAAATTATTVDDGNGGKGMVSSPSSSALASQKTTDIDIDQTSKLLPKLLRYTKMFFGGRHFYMSYDYDITRRFGVEDMGKSYLPLHRVVDPLVRVLSCYVHVISQTAANYGTVLLESTFNAAVHRKRSPPPRSPTYAGFYWSARVHGRICPEAHAGSRG